MHSDDHHDIVILILQPLRRALLPRPPLARPALRWASPLLRRCVCRGLRSVCGCMCSTLLPCNSSNHHNTIIVVVIITIIQGQINLPCSRHSRTCRSNCPRTLIGGRRWRRGSHGRQGSICRGRLASLACLRARRRASTFPKPSAQTR